MKKILTLIQLSLILLATNQALAGPLKPGALNGGNSTPPEDVMANSAGYEIGRSSNIYATVISQVITAFLGLLGIIFLIIIIVAGYKYFTAGDNAENGKKALGSIYNAVIGLIIIVAAYAITVFVFKNLPLGGFNG